MDYTISPKAQVSTRFPYGLAMSRDGRALFVASDGAGQIITDWQATNPVVSVVSPPVGGRANQCVPVDPRIFDPEKAKDPDDPDYGKARQLPSTPMDDPEEMENILRRGEAETKPR